MVGGDDNEYGSRRLDFGLRIALPEHLRSRHVIDLGPLADFEDSDSGGDCKFCRICFRTSNLSNASRRIECIGWVR